MTKPKPHEWVKDCHDRPFTDSYRKIAAALIVDISKPPKLEAIAVVDFYKGRP